MGTKIERTETTAARPFAPKPLSTTKTKPRPADGRARLLATV